MFSRPTRALAIAGLALLPACDDMSPRERVVVGAAAGAAMANMAINARAERDMALLVATSVAVGQFRVSVYQQR